MSADPRFDPHNDPACRDADHELFYPLSGRGDIAEIAKAICHRCPLEAACLAWAIESKQAHGVLGGQTAKEREAVRRKAAKAAIAEANRRDAAAALAEINRRSLLGDLLAERDGDVAALIKEMVHPPMPIAAWSEPEWGAVT